ncbi:MAG TPA: PP2C family protein-serine/threonine phosphatase [Acidisarcina sp.]
MNGQMEDAEIRAQLDLAAQVQLGLLPQPHRRLAGWETAFSYQAAGHISGDYLDLIEHGQDAFYFILGDVSGKGIAASLLMSHLHASLRVLLASHNSLEEVVRETSRLFCHSSLPAQFATLAIGHATNAGDVKLVNAGHTPVMLARQGGVDVFSSTGMPLGMFCATDFAATQFVAEPDHSLFLYSDGVTEAEGPDGSEYGADRVQQKLADLAGRRPEDIIVAMKSDLESFVAAPELADDRSMLALRFVGSELP